MKTFDRQRVCVIGGLGFIGANLADRLLSEGAAVTVLTPLRERHGDQADAFERRGARIVEGDLRDRELVPSLVAKQDVVFNLAGQSGAVRSMEDPWSDLDINLRGNLVLLESIRTVAPQAKLVFAGSRLQYGKPVRIPVREEDEADAAVPARRAQANRRGIPEAVQKVVRRAIYHCAHHESVRSRPAEGPHGVRRDQSPGPSCPGRRSADHLR